MLPSLALYEDLQHRLGLVYRPETPEGLRAVAALNDASAWVRSAAGVSWVDDLGDLEADVPDIVVAVTLAVAERIWRNPSGVSQTSVGDVSVSYSRDMGGSALTEDERRAVRAAAHGGTYSLTSVVMTKDYGGD